MIKQEKARKPNLLIFGHCLMESFLLFHVMFIIVLCDQLFCMNNQRFPF